MAHAIRTGGLGASWPDEQGRQKITVRKGRDGWWYTHVPVDPTYTLAHLSGTFTEALGHVRDTVNRGYHLHLPSAQRV